MNNDKQNKWIIDRGYGSSGSCALGICGERTFIDQTINFLINLELIPLRQINKSNNMMFGEIEPVFLIDDPYGNNFAYIYINKGLKGIQRALIIEGMGLAYIRGLRGKKQRQFALEHFKKWNKIIKFQNFYSDVRKLICKNPDDSYIWNKFFCLTNLSN